MTNLYLEAHKRQKELLKLESTLKARLAKYPQGRMRMITKGNFVMYYLRRSPSDSTWTYISVHDEKKIRTFLQVLTRILTHTHLRHCKFHVFVPFAAGDGNSRIDILSHPAASLFSSSDLLFILSCRTE